MVSDPIILASASPRRQELLGRIHIPFFVDAAHVDEQLAGSPREVVQSLARRKAEAVAPRHPGAIILGADTIVYLDGILGKPRDTADAIAMLSHLSGRWHEVYTGVSIILGEQCFEDVAITRVHFIPITGPEIHDYVATGEPMDKAGAYAIQGMAGMFIDEIAGCPYNVMGLPLVLTKRLLDNARCHGPKER